MSQERRQRNSAQKDNAPPATHRGSSRGMGLGKLGGMNMVFVRKFRFTLEANNLEEWSVKSVALNLTKKQLLIKGYEVIETGDTNQYRTPNIGKDAPIEIWASGLSDNRWPNQVLMLTTFDGCGSALYEYTFTGLKLIDWKLDFDVDSSEASCQTLLVGFDNYKRDFMLDKPPTYQWRFILDGSSREIDVQIADRPQINIDETGVSHLHGTMWVPGKVKWKSMTMTVKEEDIPSLLNLINSGVQESYTKGTIKYYDAKNQAKESWKLNHLWTKGFERKEDCGVLHLCYTEVSYENLEDIKDC